MVKKGKKLRVQKPKGQADGILDRDSRAWGTVLKLRKGDPKLGKKLTKRAMSWWQREKDASGYASFKGLSGNDIWSVLAAAERGEVLLKKNKWGHIAWYKIR